MSRRRSGLDDVVELAALLPWWLSLVIAIVAESRVGPRQATQPKAVTLRQTLVNRPYRASSDPFFAAKPRGPFRRPCASVDWAVSALDAEFRPEMQRLRSKNGTGKCLFRAHSARCYGPTPRPDSSDGLTAR